MRIFFILATIWFAWRMAGDMANDDTPFGVMVLHLMLFFINFFVGLILTE